MLECGYLVPKYYISVEKPGPANICKIHRKWKEKVRGCHTVHPYSKNGPKMLECGYLVPNDHISVKKSGPADISKIIRK